MMRHIGIAMIVTNSKITAYNMVRIVRRKKDDHYKLQGSREAYSWN